MVATTPGGRRWFTCRVLALVGLARRVLELVLTGRELPATEGLAIGLVTRVVPRVDLGRVVGEIARTLAGFSPATVGLGKEAFYRALELPYARALEQWAQWEDVARSTDFPAATTAPTT